MNNLFTTKDPETLKIINIAYKRAQHFANTGECQQCILTNDFGGVDIKPIKSVQVVSNPNLIGIVSPYFNPLSNQRTSDSQWMQPNDYLALHKYNKLTGKH